jgi:hypothetical protein
MTVGGEVGLEDALCAVVGAAGAPFANTDVNNAQRTSVIVVTNRIMF